jgi:hypothetical protein
MSRLAITSLVVVCAGLLAAAGELVAEEKKIHCKTLEIEASAKDGGIDQALPTPIAEKLRGKAFREWKSFKLVQSPETDVPLAEKAEVAVTDGKLILHYIELEKEDKHKPRIRLRFTLNNAKGKRRVRTVAQFDPGDYAPLIVEEHKATDIAHIFATTCALK